MADLTAEDILGSSYTPRSPQKKRGWKDIGSELLEVASAPAKGLNAFLLNAANSATMGAVPEAADAAYQMITGKQGTPVQGFIDDVSGMAPVAGAMGDFAGYIAPASMMEKAVVGGAKQVGRHGPAIADWLVNRWGGRAVTGAATGAVDTLAQSLVQDQQLPTGGELAKGVASGGIGQATLGEGLNKAGKYLSGSEGFKEGATNLMQQIDDRMGTGGTTGRETPVEDIIAERQRLGDTATLVDASPELNKMAKETISDPAKVRNMPNIVNKYSAGAEERLANIRGQFDEDVTGAIPDTFQTNTQSGAVKGARSIAHIKEAGKRNRQKLQSEYDAVFNTITPETNPMYGQDQIERQMRNSMGGVPVTESDVKDWEAIGRLLDHANIDSINKAAKADKLDPNSLPEGYIGPRQLLDVKKGINRLINDAMLGTTPDIERARTLYTFKDTIDDALAGGLGDDFVKVNQQYADEFTAERAAELAYRTVLGSGTDPKKSADFLALDMERAGEANRAAYLEGGVRGIMDLMGKDVKDVSSARKAVKDKAFQDKIGALFGEESKEQIIDAANKAIDMAGSTKALQGQATGGENKDFREHLANLVRTGVVAGFLPKLVGRTSISSTPAAAGSLLGIVRSAGDGASPVATRYMDNLLAREGEAADYGLRKAQDLSKDDRYSNSLIGRWFGGDEQALPVGVDKGVADLLQRQWGIAPAMTATQSVREEEPTREITLPTLTLQAEP